ncbi:hypothetical protein ACVIRO_001290 [Rhizobium ruizarguesonis]
MNEEQLRALVREEALRLLQDVVSRIPGTGDYIKANLEIAMGTRPRR